MTYSDYSLTDIANWLLNPCDVSLPAIQRGFVWKPAQIENLWDSIFRDYPIGSLMLTKEGQNKMIIDGQQRATAIALGFYNPWKQERSRIGNAKNLPTVWLDIAPSKCTNNCEFVFRVTTRSHPWGYQRDDNSSTLGIGPRTTAAKMYKELFGVDAYTTLAPGQRLPFDADVPVPLCFLFESFLSTKTAEEWWQEVAHSFREHIPSSYKTLHTASVLESLESVDFLWYYDIIKRLLENYRVPSIIVDNALILNNSDNSSENPTLFVRLNRSGTPLEGEELLYSIYKASYPNSKNLVENVGSNIIAASRIITLISRLILSQMYGRYYKGLSLVQFQKEIRNGEFRSRMESFIGNDWNSPITDLVRKGISILTLEGTIPDVIVKRFVRECPNGILVLLNWLTQNETEAVTPRLTKLICEKLYRLYWFGDLNSVVEHTWDQSSLAGYWEMPVVNYGGYAMHPLVDPDILESFLLKRLDLAVEDHSITSADAEIWDVWAGALQRPEDMTDESFQDAVRTGWANFLWRLMTNKYLILLAQRDFIKREFRDFNQLEDLQDTNTPWDWDHIYPNSWVYRLWNMDARTKNWEWRIGNFRAMSLVDNRSENNSINAAPAARFRHPDPDYFIKENDLEYWSRLKDSSKDESFIVNHASAIILITVNIYREFLNVIVK